MPLNPRQRQYALNTMSLKERREAFQAAKSKMEPADLVVIEGLIDVLIAVAKAKRTSMQLSRDGALEVIAGIGIFMVERGPAIFQSNHK